MARNDSFRRIVELQTGPTEMVKGDLISLN